MFCFFFIRSFHLSNQSNIIMCSFFSLCFISAINSRFNSIPQSTGFCCFFSSCIDAEVCRLEPLTEHKPLHFESTKTDVNQWVRHMLVQTDCKNVIRWSQMSQGTLLAHFVGCWVGCVFFCSLFLLILFLNKKWSFLYSNDVWICHVSDSS